MTPDGDDGGGLRAVEEPMASSLGLLGRYARKVDLATHAPADSRGLDRVPIPIHQRLEQPGTRFLPMLDQLPADAAQPAVLPAKFDDLDGFRADIDADKTARPKLVRTGSWRIGKASGCRVSLEWCVAVHVCAEYIMRRAAS